MYIYEVNIREQQKLIDLVEENPFCMIRRAWIIALYVYNMQRVEKIAQKANRKRRKSVTEQRFILLAICPQKDRVYRNT